MNGSEWALLLPIGVVLLSALVCVFLDLVISHRDRYILPWVGLTGMVLGGLAVGITQGELSGRIPWFSTYATPGLTILNGSFCLDTFALGAWVLSCLAGGLAILCSPVPEEETSVLSTGEYYGLITLAVAGMMLLCVSHEFMTLLLSLEIMSIATYILAGSNRTDVRSNEAAMKYLVLGGFSTAFLLMGIAFYFGAFGSLSLTPNAGFENLLNTAPDEARSRFLFVLIGMGLLLAGALFKVGAVPFHFWVPDVYEGAPTPVTGLMAVGVKIAAFAVVARLVLETFGTPYYAQRLGNWHSVLELAAVLTMIIGNILAMRQDNVKRMLAYSGIAHTGYLLLGLLLQPGASNEVVTSHVQAMLFYLLVYGVMTLGAFGVISLVREDGKPLEKIEDYAGLARAHPGIALCMAAFLFSLAGLPPLGGFFAKFLVFRGAVDQGYVLAAVMGILTSVASLYYYLRVVVAMYMSSANDESTDPAKAARCRFAWSSNLLIYAAAIVTLVVGLAPNWFYR